jgi:hypothetical protein
MGSKPEAGQVVARPLDDLRVGAIALQLNRAKYVRAFNEIVARAADLRE